MYFWTTLVLLSGIFSYVICDAVIPCMLSEASCLEKTTAEAYSNFVNADPELGTENLDPMQHDVIEGNLSTLRFKFTNTTVEGFKDCKIESVKLYSELNSLHIVLICPKLAMYGKYDIKGRLIVLPVEGNGDYRISSKKYRITIDTELKKSPGKDGKTYMSIINFKETTEPLDSMTFDLKNLFNGQRDLADAVLKFANENWVEIDREFAGPIAKANIKKIIKNANKYFKKRPIDDLL